MILNLSPIVQRILEMIKQLSNVDRDSLALELEKEDMGNELSEILRQLRTNDLDEETIRAECEEVRSELYALKNTEKGSH